MTEDEVYTVAENIAFLLRYHGGPTIANDVERISVTVTHPDPYTTALHVVLHAPVTANATGANQGHKMLKILVHAKVQGGDNVVEALADQVNQEVMKVLETMEANQGSGSKL